MATTIEQQVALDETLVPSIKRLRIGRSNFRLPFDIQSKESTLFKMNNKKHIIDLESFRDMLHVCPRVPGQSFDELPFEANILEFLRNTTAYKEYYAYATGVAAPKPNVSARKKRGDSDTSLTSPIATPTPITTAAPVPRQETHISQHGGSYTDEGSDVDAQDEGDKNDQSDDGSDDGNDDDNDETVKDGSERDEEDDDDDEATESDRESEDEETREQEEESFDPIPRTPKDNEDDGNGDEDQGLRISEEDRMQEEEEADELYRDVNINQGRGLQVSQNVEDSHVTLTPVHPDGLQESSSVSSFVTSMLNPISDAVDLSEMELKKILTEKMEGNKSIQRSDEQRNLYKALVEAYDADKTILDAYGESTILKQRREDDDRKDPPLDQTEGLKDEEKEGSMHQLALHLKQPPRGPADLPQGLNLDSCLPVSLLLQRNLCRLP
nr:hypothetical protein [Tanacetum cinerariifolium]